MNLWEILARVALITLGFFYTKAYALQDYDKGTGVSITGEYTTGDYGTNTDTRIWYFPVTISKQTNVSYVSLTIPYIIVNGTGEVIITGGHRVMQTTTTTTRSTEYGLGDVMFYVAYDVISETANTPNIALGAEVKFGTADENKNLGSGENDYAIEINLFKGLNTFVYYGGIGYRYLGDPSGIELDNIIYAHVGGEIRQNTNFSSGVRLDFSQGATAGDADKKEIKLYFRKAFSNQSQVTPYAIIGLDEGSPDWGAGITLSFYH